MPGQKPCAPSGQRRPCNAAASPWTWPSARVGIGEGRNSPGIDRPLQYALLLYHRAESDWGPGSEVSTEHFCGALPCQKRGLTGATLGCTARPQRRVQRHGPAAVPLDSGLVKRGNSPARQLL